jgi:exonuclease III
MAVEQDRSLEIINVYVPNQDKYKKVFFKQLKTKIDNIKDKKNIVILGDFNCMKEELERYPHRLDNNGVMQVWKNIKNSLRIINK